MTRDRKTVRPSHRARRRLIALMLLSVGGVITGRAVYNHYTSPERIRRIAVAFLERHTHGQVAIERASFSWLGGVRLFNVSVRDMHTPNGGPPIGMSIAGPGDAPSPRLTEPPRRADVARSSKPPSERAGLFTCRRVDVQHSPWWMLLGRFRVIAATAYEPTCTIVRNMRDGSTNLNGLLRVAAPQAGGAALRLPIIELRDARVSVVRRDETGDHAAENLELTIRGRPAPGSASLYDVVWQTPGGAGGSGQTQIDLSAGALRNIHGVCPRCRSTRS